MERTINPDKGIYPATPDYVHALEVTGAERLLFVSGTMGLDVIGRAPKSLEEQLDLVWANLRRILTEADMTTDNIVRVTSYFQIPTMPKRTRLHDWSRWAPDASRPRPLWFER
ncbi:RidA family protein [Roseibium aggregatum]|nr:RidA family protein [Roseibium aggregatum]WJS05393.1 RidA family protein [Roseibium aggregatum]